MAHAMSTQQSRRDNRRYNKMSWQGAVRTFDDGRARCAAASTLRVVREALGELLTTLDFQGKIDGPQSVDAARAGPAMKARLESDPYARFDAASAAAIKARLSRIVPLWVGYISLTAVGG